MKKNSKNLLFIIPMVVGLSSCQKNTSINLSAIQKFNTSISTHFDLVANDTISESDINQEASLITSNVIDTLDSEIAKKISTHKSIQNKKIVAIKKNNENKFALNNSELININAHKSNVKIIKLSNLYSIPNEKIEQVFIAKNDDSPIVKFESKKMPVVLAQENGPIEPPPQEYSPQPQMPEEPMPEQIPPQMPDESNYNNSKIERPVINKMYSNNISQRVRDVIHREMKKTIRDEVVEKKSAPIKKTNIPLQAPVTTAVTTQAFSDVNTHDDFTNSNSSSSSSVEMIASEIKLAEGNLQSVSGFEFIPDYDRNERVSDESGKINFKHELQGTGNIITGVVSSQYSIPTRIDIDLNLEDKINVPLLEQESMHAFFEKHNDGFNGNLILIKLNDEINKVNIDSEYSKIYYFDDKMKEVAKEDDAEYIMYSGVKTGNVLISYNLNKETAQKVIYVGDGEMFFDDPIFIDGEKEVFEMSTRPLLANTPSLLNIKGTQINFFNSDKTALKKAIGAYEIAEPVMSSGMNKYLELKHLNDTLFVGIKNTNKIEIPAKDYVLKVMDTLGIQELGNQCIIQVNIQNPMAERMMIGGKNIQGEMLLTSKFMNKSGEFVESSDDLLDVERAFILGEAEGIVNAKIEYSNGKQSMLKSFCAKGTYIVENL